MLGTIAPLMGSASALLGIGHQVYLILKEKNSNQLSLFSAFLGIAVNSAYMAYGQEIKNNCLKYSCALNLFCCFVLFLAILAYRKKAE